MAIYVKLGKQANNFSDPTTGFNIAGPEVLILPTRANSSRKTQNALKGGHLVRASKSDYDKFQQSVKERVQPEEVLTSSEKSLKKQVKALSETLNDLKNQNQELLGKLEEKENKEDDVEDHDELVDFDEMSQKELTAYYQENFEVDEDMLKTFRKLSKAKMVEELTSLES